MSQLTRNQSTYLSDYIHGAYEACAEPEDVTLVDRARGGMHDGGEAVSYGKNNGNVDRFLSIVVDFGMLLKKICDGRPGFRPGGSVIPTLEHMR